MICDHLKLLVPETDVMILPPEPGWSRILICIHAANPKHVITQADKLRAEFFRGGRGVLR